MAKLDAIIEGLQIARKYLGDGYHTGAEHDVFYIYPVKGITPEDAARLTELGWRTDRDGGWSTST